MKDLKKITEEEIERLKDQKAQELADKIHLEQNDSKKFELIEKYQNGDFDFIHTFFEKSKYRVIKIHSEQTSKYILYREHPILKYTNKIQTTKSDLIEELVVLFKKESPNWYILDYKTQEEGIKALRDYISYNIPRIDSLINDPAEDIIFKDEKEGITYFNLFRSSELLINRPNVDLDFPTIRKVIFNLCENNEQYYNWFINWLAVLYQNPTYRFNTSVNFVGEPGSGKGMLALALRKIFGVTCYSGNSKDLSSNFNAQMLEGKLLLLANEILDQQKKYQFSNDLKELITEQNISVEKKFKDRYIAKNYIKCIFFSNSNSPISIEEGDRRYAVFKSKKIDLPYEIRQKYHEDTDNFLTNEVLGFCSYLNKLQVSLDIAVNEPIMTNAKQDIININETDFKGAIIDIMELLEVNWKLKDNGKYYILQNELYNKYSETKEKIPVKKFGSKLSINGFDKERTTISLESGRWIAIPISLVEKLKGKVLYNINKELTKEQVFKYFVESNKISKEYDLDKAIIILKKQGAISEPRDKVYKIQGVDNL